MSKTVVLVKKNNFIFHLTADDLKKILADLHDESMYSKADIEDIDDWVEWYFEEMDEESIEEVLGRYYDEKDAPVVTYWADRKSCKEMLDKLWDYPEEEEE